VTDDPAKTLALDYVFLDLAVDNHPGLCHQIAPGKTKGAWPDGHAPPDRLDYASALSSICLVPNFHGGRGNRFTSRSAKE
jgi:hypothetical protein